MSHCTGTTLLIGIALFVTNVTGLSNVYKSYADFQFPDGSQPNPQPAPAPTGGNSDVFRQGPLTVGNLTTTGILNSLTPLIQTPLVGQYNTSGTCICVPTGRCSGTGGGNYPTDGSGQLDIRIVTSLLPVASIVSPTIVTQCQASILERCCLAGSYQCGVRYPPVTGSRVPVNGQSNYGAYPWVAVLLGPGDVYAGAGVLIDNLNVLTAAHKVRDFQTSGRALKVRLGEWDASSNTEPIAFQEFTVARYFIHPNFNSLNLKNDVAVLRLSTPVTLGITPTISTACLPPTSFIGQRCWVAGWGKSDFSATGQYQAVQKEVDVPVRNPNDCQTLFASTRLGPSFQFDSQSFLCAGGESGKDACTGDGGSPLVCDNGGRWFVVGLVAWGIGCGSSNVPGAYVNVVNYVSWIQSAVSTT